MISVNKPIQGLLSALVVAGLVLIGPVAADAASDGSPGEGSAVGLYAAEPAPLTPVECGQCHPQHFRGLKDEGGRHQFECQNCHQVFHAFNPLKGNYADLMPRCSACHDQLHGTKHVRCLTCHTDPHAPLRAPAFAQVKDACADCHAGPAKQLKDQPSKHTQQACALCHHDSHGYIPSCFECHQPHFPQQPLSACAECHPVHQPKQISFTPATEAVICRDCHGEVFHKWQGSPSKHAQVNCTSCHTQHAKIPGCGECHQSPHPEAQLRMFPNCLDCHLDVHDLPVKKK